eukprot:403374724
MSTTSNANSLNQTKFQFDFYINKVELAVPSPIYIFVQVLKGTHSLNTKKKLKIDSHNKIATFNEKLSIVTALSRGASQQQMQIQDNDDNYSRVASIQGGGFQSKVIQLRLIAFYNSKEKAIGICSVDLAQFVTGHKEANGRVPHKAVFQKCFDKNASINFEVRAKEQFNPIKEQITEETENSNLNESDCSPFNDDVLSNIPDSFRGSLIDNTDTFLNTEEELLVQNQDEDKYKNTNSNDTNPNSVSIKLITASSRNSVLDHTPQSKTQPLKYYEAALKSQRTQVIQKPNNSPHKTLTLNSARSSNALKTQSLQKQSSLPQENNQSTPIQSQNTKSQSKIGFSSTQQLPDYRSSTPVLTKTQLVTSSETTPFGSGSAESQQQIRKLEDNIRKLEYENKTLKQENLEQKQRIITLEIKEERMRDYEIKCNEADSYRQKAQTLEATLRKLQQEQNSFEDERLVIIESYERKLQDMRQQLNESQSTVNTLQLQTLQYQTQNTVESTTQADEEPQSLRSPFKTQNQSKQNKQISSLQNTLNDQDDIDSIKQKLTFDDLKPQNDSEFKELYEKMMIQYQFTLKDNSENKKRSEMLEKQLMKSKEQIAQLVNELYSLEKENIYDR